VNKREAVEALFASGTGGIAFTTQLSRDWQLRVGHAIPLTTVDFVVQYPSWDPSLREALAEHGVTRVEEIAESFKRNYIEELLKVWP
jgi:hypothetical protein